MRFSIVIPLFNKEQTIRRALLSVINQDYQDFEIIIVNDGSTDLGRQKAAGIRDPRIRIIDQENRGVSAARNAGIQAARNRMIAFLDADDEWMPDFLQTIVQLHQKYPECEVYGTSYLIGSPSGKIKRAHLFSLLKNEHDLIMKNYFEIVCQSDPPFNSSSVAVSKESISAVGMFPVGILGGEDLLTWARLAMNYQIAFSTRVCSIYWRPDWTERNVRTPDERDRVAEELQDMFMENGAFRNRQYRFFLAHWYKMRAATYLARNDGSRARRHACSGLQLRPWHPRLWAFLIISIFPGQSKYRIWKTLRAWYDR